ncbi:MAG TPA: cupin domain-containing protein [Acidobacteriota bacterium]|nr:cupin domain-containing protein [Acidobacteriota bacterium]
MSAVEPKPVLQLPVQDPELVRFTRYSGNFRWEGIATKEYKPSEGDMPGFCGILRQTLFGQPEDAVGFEVRYFEIEPGGWSSLECHGHSHAVIGLRGKGQILLGSEVKSLGFLDLAYIGPNQIHRLANDSNETFGFICIVDHHRDRPLSLNPEDVPHLMANPETARLAKRSISE